MDRKRVGVLTFHMAHNYGAMLQAYAMSSTLKNLGYEGEIINYRFPYIDQWSRVEYLKDLIQRHGAIGGGLRYVKRLLRGDYNPKTARNKFSYFERHIIPHSKEYWKVEDLERLQYESIVFGSDQIWNAELTDGAAPVYIGDFKTERTIKKVAFAASCGKAEFCDDVKERYLESIRRFDAIGVRETGLSKMLAKNGIKSRVVLDPTLLLPAEDWTAMVKCVHQKVGIPKKYLLVYAFDESTDLYEYVRGIGKERDLEIVVIAYERKDCMHGMHVYTNCGPADFVNLMMHAEIVVTTSFHGTAFSIIMQREFYCIPHPRYRERTDSLLYMLHLEGRNINIGDNIEVMAKIDWDEVGELLAEEQKKSLDFFREALR